MPQLEGTDDGEAAEQAVTPSLRGEKEVKCMTDTHRQKCFVTLQFVLTLEMYTRR